MRTDSCVPSVASQQSWSGKSARTGNPLYATGDYRQRMEGVFVKAAIKRGQKSLLILLSVSRLGRRPRQSSNDVKIRKSRPGAFS